MRNALDRAELLLSLVAPFLGLAAVAAIRPDRVGWIGWTGWLPMVLFGYLAVGTFPPPERGWWARVRPFVGPALIVVGQLASGESRASAWALETAICGMGARGVALGWLLVSALVRRGGVDDWRVAGPGTALILGMSAPTIVVLAESALAVGVSLPVLALAFAFSLRADVTRFADLPAGFREPGEGGVVGIALAPFAWMGVAAAAVAWSG